MEREGVDELAPEVLELAVAAEVQAPGLALRYELDEIDSCDRVLTIVVEPLG